MCYMLSSIKEKEGSENQDLSCIPYLSSLFFQTHEEQKPQLLSGNGGNKREKPTTSPRGLQLGCWGEGEE